jgi:sucrose phosphorylase
MLNVYPDSVGGNLANLLSFLEKEECQSVFQSVYLLPSVFHSDLDRGFSVIDYNLNELYASEKDIERITEKNITLKLDFILNHISVLSPQFQDLIRNGDASKYRDFFIDWNSFWQGNGEMTDEGYIQPDDEHIKKMFFRKEGLPILMVQMPDKSSVPYWNTFYQKVTYPCIDEYTFMEEFRLQYGVALALANRVKDSLQMDKKPKEIDFDGFGECKDSVISYLEKNRRYLGQMDLNIKSPLVWEFYENVIRTLSEYGCKIVRLDAFAYASKIVGAKNFLNEPETWILLEKLGDIAAGYDIELLPEIHSTYEDKTHERIAEKGYLTYDFFLPGLAIDAIENKNFTKIVNWANELYEKKIRSVNMLGCHDGIPLLDLKGMLSEEEIDGLIEIVVSRGGHIKNLHGQKNMYYQVNATYYSALGEDDNKMLLARAIQCFMPGIPQVWYLDLFAGKNDYEAMRRSGKDGHKEINRTNLTMEDIEEGLHKDIVIKQLELLRFRNECHAFEDNAQFIASLDEGKVVFSWEKAGTCAKLYIELETLDFVVTVGDGAVFVKE